eukprot:c23693_g1_i1.p1 GENE.c23693_g1_i1~~c23693_g1_i1.p1  ORF type:complete len:123 (-),score=26.34 c23693_g1_i1:58-372(-)
MLARRATTLGMAMKLAPSIIRPAVVAIRHNTNYVESLKIDTELKTPQEMVLNSKWIEVDSHNVKCVGGKDNGHPAVYFKLVKPGVPVACNYCGNMFVFNSSHHH